MSSLPFWSPLEVILPHRHILRHGAEGERRGYKLQLLPCHLDHNTFAARKKRKQFTHSSADLPIFISHAVSVVQISKGLGCPPGLQVAGHPDWRSHLGSVQCMSGTVMVLRAPTLHLDGRTVSFLMHSIQCLICILITMKHVLTLPLGWWPDKW